MGPKHKIILLFAGWCLSNKKKNGVWFRHCTNTQARWQTQAVLTTMVLSMFAAEHTMPLLGNAENDV